MKPTLSKDDLETQKLALEIRELQRAWWQRPAYLATLIPIVLGSLTFLAGILSGYFDRERIHLKSEVEGLKREESALLETQNLIRQANADAGERLKKFNERYEELRNRILSTSNYVINHELNSPNDHVEIAYKLMDLYALAENSQKELQASPTPTPEQKK
jgi:hypothetical protein